MPDSCQIVRGTPGASLWPAEPSTPLCRRSTAKAALDHLSFPSSGRSAVLTHIQVLSHACPKHSKGIVVRRPSRYTGSVTRTPSTTRSRRSRRRRRASSEASTTRLGAQVEVTLDKGRQLVEKDRLARTFAYGRLREGADFDGTDRSRMRNAKAGVNLGVTAAREGGLEQAFIHGERALQGRASVRPVPGHDQSRTRGRREAALQHRASGAGLPEPPARPW